MGTRVFVSYAHGSAEHIAQVRAFVSFLRTDGGIDARIDLAADDQRRDWPLWMAEQTRLADFVLVVASQRYRERAERLVPGDVGRGVGYEAALLRELCFQDRAGWLAKILPVVLPGQSRDGIPDFLQPYSATHYPVTSFTVAGAESLLRVLLGRPRFVAEPVGPPPALPAPGGVDLARVRARYADAMADAWRDVTLGGLGDAGDPARVVRLPLTGLHVELDAGEPLSELVEREPVLAVRGVPGSGKSVLCRWWGARLADELARGGERVPVLVPLAEYAAANAEAFAAGGRPDSLVAARAVPGASAEQVAAMVADALRRAQAVLLLDGLDEVGAHRTAVLQALAELRARHPGNRLLITSRGAIAVPDAVVREIRPLSRARVAEYARAFAEVVGGHAAGLLAELDRVPELTGTPLHLAALCLLWHGKGALPRSRTALYRELVLDLAARWRAPLAPDGPAALRGLLEDEDRVLAVLAHLAAAVQDRYPGGGIPETALVDLVERALVGPSWFTRPPDPGMGAALREVLRTKVGVLAEATPGVYAFPHPLVREYLACLTLVPDARVSGATLAAIGDRLADPRWREPVVLALSSLSATERAGLLRAVVEDVDVDLWADVALAACAPDEDLAALAAVVFAGCRALAGHPRALSALVDRLAAARAAFGPAFDAARPDLLPPEVYAERGWLSPEVLRAVAAGPDTPGRDRALRRAAHLVPRDALPIPEELWGSCVADDRCAAALAVLVGGLDDIGAVESDALYGELADSLVRRDGPGLEDIAAFLDGPGKALLISRAPRPRFAGGLAVRPVGPEVAAALAEWARTTPGDPAALRARLARCPSAEVAVAVLDGRRVRDERAAERVGDAAARAQGPWLAAVWSVPGLSEAERASAHVALRWVFATVSRRWLDVREPRSVRAGVVAADRLGRLLAGVDPDRRGLAPRFAPVPGAALAWLSRLPTWSGGAVAASGAALSSDPVVSALDRLDVATALLGEAPPGLPAAVMAALRPVDLGTPAGLETAHLAWRHGVATVAETAALTSHTLASAEARPAHFARTPPLPGPSRELSRLHYLGRRGLADVSTLLPLVAEVDAPASDVGAVLLDLAALAGSAGWRATAETLLAEWKWAPEATARADGETRTTRHILTTVSTAVPLPERTAGNALIAVTAPTTAPRPADTTPVTATTPVPRPPARPDLSACLDAAEAGDERAIVALVGPVRDLTSAVRRYRLSTHGASSWVAVAGRGSEVAEGVLRQYDIDDPQETARILAVDPVPLLRTASLWRPGPQAVLAAFPDTRAITATAGVLAALGTLEPVLRDAVLAPAPTAVTFPGVTHRMETVRVAVAALADADPHAAFTSALVPVTDDDLLADYGALHFHRATASPDDASRWIPATLDRRCALTALAAWLSTLDPNPVAIHDIAEWDAVTALAATLADGTLDWELQPLLHAAVSVPSRLTRQAAITLLARLPRLDAAAVLPLITSAARSPSPALRRAALRLAATPALHNVPLTALVDALPAEPHPGTALAIATVAATAAADCQATERRALRALLRSGIPARLTELVGTGTLHDPLTAVDGGPLSVALRALA